MLTWREWAIAVIVGVILGMFGTGCTDYEDAANIAKDVAAAHEEKQTVAALWWYSETYQPFKASDANVDITVCQSSDSTINWYCHAGVYTR